MLKNKRVILFYIMSIVAAIIIVIFVAIRSGKTTPIDNSSDEYLNGITELSDTISELKGNILKYEEAIKKLEEANKGVREELIQLIKDNEKTDSMLSNSSWDYNIKYLTEYLSKKDSLGE